VNEDGALLFEKLRFPGKKFTQRAKNGGGAWAYKLDGVRKVLYRLPEVVRASDVMICEGEKDADRVKSLKLSGHPSAPASGVTATTNFDGAGKWRPEYSPYFTGKHVVIFPDNDAVGKNHARQVAAWFSVCARHGLWNCLGWASRRCFRLPDLHNAEDLLSESADSTLETGEELCWSMRRKFLYSFTGHRLACRWPDSAWGKWFHLCAPKLARWLAVDLVLSLALGLPWAGFDVAPASRVAHHAGGQPRINPLAHGSVDRRQKSHNGGP
jgi:hypothetical protein